MATDICIDFTVHLLVKNKYIILCMLNNILNLLIIPETKTMYIILALFLLMGLNGSRADPLESIEHLKPNNVIEDTKNRFLWTVHQLERCYLWSRTLPYEERLDYLITLQRKVYTFLRSIRRDRRPKIQKNHFRFPTPEISAMSCSTVTCSNYRSKRKYCIAPQRNNCVFVWK